MHEETVSKKAKHHRIRGAINVMCPECGKPTRSNMRSGRDVSLCNRCDVWFITTNEVYTKKLRDFYQIFTGDEESEIAV
jgi:ribosomal protein L37AE/L43A